MPEIPLEKLWHTIDRLTERQRGSLRPASARTPEERSVLAALNGPDFRPPACPNCTGARLQRWGLAGGLQRYRCTACLRTCNPLTGTPLARLRRRDLWLGHVEALREGVSLRTAARRLGVHHHTTFRWRHRWLVNPAAIQARALGGIVEVAAVPFHENGRGWSTGRRVAIAAGPPAPPSGDARPSPPPPVHALILCDRTARRADMVLPRLDSPAVAALLAPLMSAEPVALRSDGEPALAAAARLIGVLHQPVSAPDGPADGGLATVRGYRDRLAAWMQRFDGVSTRYLAHYLGWRRLLERAPSGPGPLAWLRLAVGGRPTANVDSAQGAADGVAEAAAGWGRVGWRGQGCRAAPAAPASPARPRVCARPRGAFPER